MKKLLSLLLTLALSATLFACGNSEDPAQAPASEGAEATQTADEAEEEPAEAADPDAGDTGEETEAEPEEDDAGEESPAADVPGEIVTVDFFDISFDYNNKFDAEHNDTTFSIEFEGRSANLTLLYLEIPELLGDLNYAEMMMNSQLESFEENDALTVSNLDISNVRINDDIVAKNAIFSLIQGSGEDMDIATASFVAFDYEGGAYILMFKNSVTAEKYFDEYTMLIESLTFN